jgi:hypothetical protein
VGFNRAGLWVFICYVFALLRAVIWRGRDGDC